MKIGRTGALQCDQCCQVLAPPHVTVPLKDGRTLHFCLGVDCLSEYFDLTDVLVERFERENQRTVNRWLKVVCPACRERLAEKGL